MPRSAIVTDPVFLKHQPGPYHPESPQRLKTLLDLAGEVVGGSADFELLPLRAAVQEELELCHGSGYIDLVRSTSEHNQFALDGDTITCRDSFGVALMAVGGFLQLLDGVAASDYGNGFTMVRPPGHHALRDRGMGFCLFNTVAIGARYLQKAHGPGVWRSWTGTCTTATALRTPFTTTPRCFSCPRTSTPTIRGPGPWTRWGAAREKDIP